MDLTKRQQKIVQRHLMGSAVIKGEHETGKTAMGLARMTYLLQQPQGLRDNVLFITKNKAQEELVQKRYETMKGSVNISLFDEESQVKKGTIKSIQALMTERYEQYIKENEIELKTVTAVPEVLIEEVKGQVRKQYPRVSYLKGAEHNAFLMDEIKWMMSCGYTSLEAYAMAERKARPIRLPKNGNGRKALWAIKQGVREALRKKQQILKEDMYLAALEIIKADLMPAVYRYIIIDDAEVLTKVQLEFIKALTISKGPHETLFLMSKNSMAEPYAWLIKGRSFKTIDYPMIGKVTTLRKTQKKRVNSPRQKELTPLEQFLLEQEKRQKPTLPWYIETYKYINKTTGVETVFQKDSSAGETYIDEVQQDENEVLPIYSDIAAGAPIEIIEEESGRFELPRGLTHHKKNTYMLQVQGDSMIGIDVQDGDYVVIQAGAVNDHEVAAVYYNGATTLKRIVQAEECILLVSENEKYDPIKIEEGDFRVMGKLIGVVRPM